MWLRDLVPALSALAVRGTVLGASPLALTAAADAWQPHELLCFVRILYVPYTPPLVFSCRYDHVCTRPAGKSNSSKF